MQRILCLLLLTAFASPAWSAVRVWQDTIALRTYEEGPPLTTPPFPFFDHSNPIRYPYTLRLSLAHNNRAEHAWRALHIENEYLACIVLPDLGGRLYTCKDKLSGRDMFYANPAVKKGEVGIRGAWVAMGIEMNFPTGHTWTAVSPVDFATAQNSDGSASIWVGNIERVYGMQWRVEFILKPGIAMLEQRVHLYNPTSTRHRFYWWNNASIELLDWKTRFVYPANLVAPHGLTEIITWPIDSKGLDLSVVGNHKEGAGLFAHGSREPFMAVYNPVLRFGTVHCAEASQVPGKKLWTWGRNNDNYVREDLSDGSSYVELQAGVFENQATYGFLDPQQARSFVEFWMPVRDLGGVTRASSSGVLNIKRATEAGGQVQLTLDFNPTRKVAGAKIRVLDEAKIVAEETAELDPAIVFSKTFKLTPGAKYSIKILDSSGAILLAHTEDRYDADGPETVKLGPQPHAEPEMKIAMDHVRFGELNELNGFPRFARSDYQKALKLFPADIALLKSLGRLDVEQNRFEEAVKVLTEAANRSSDDAEIHYYLGLAKAALENDPGAAKEFEAVPNGNSLHAAAGLALASVRARAGDLKTALRLVQGILSEKPEMIRAGELEVSLLRHLNENSAAARHDYWRALDPTDALLRYEGTKLAKTDPSLWRHLSADPERVLNLAITYMDLGFYPDALDLLGHQYEPPEDAYATEPGAVLPQSYRLIAYYRGYCRARGGGSGRADFDEASKLSVRYVFPNRASTFAVLKAAVKENPTDATALDLLGSLYFAYDDVDNAMAWWERARQAHSSDPELYKALGRALFELKNERWAALEVYREGLKLAPSDADLKKGVEAALRPAEAPKSVTAEQKGTSQSAPQAASKPAEFAAYALSLLAAGDIGGAQSVFSAKNFPGKKQEPAVREAYIEVQVQTVLQMAHDHKCTEALDAADRLGDENHALPFTFNGFGNFLKGPRIQYYLGEAAYLCGNTKEARKVWAKVAKSSRDVSDVDFVFPYLAISRTNPEAKSQLNDALAQIRSAAQSGSANPTLQYSEAMLLAALGNEAEAMKLLVMAAKSPQPAMTNYLARLAMRQGLK
jgi:tetratricopeptide (TPR) repeat protein